jgi:hypothetical protein
MANFGRKFLTIIWISGQRGTQTGLNWNRSSRLKRDADWKQRVAQDQWLQIGFL